MTKKMETPLVSIVLPSYNQADYLPQALESLMAQTYPHWEAVVVNDGSKDSTAEVIEAWSKKDSRIRGVNKANGGITSALNAGIADAKGQYFCWLSTDDYFLPRKLESQVEAFQRLGEDYVMVYGAFDLLHEVDNSMEEVPVPQPLIKGTEFAEGFRHDFIDGCTIMIRMETLKAIGGFNAHYLHAQDFEMWLKLGSLGKYFHLVPEKVCVRRVHVRQSSTGNMIHCRYDAASMIHYYLTHYHLFEVYRDFNLEDTNQRKIFVSHLAGRANHIESNVNNPINFDLFWKWIDTGLNALPVAMQKTVLEELLSTFIQNQEMCTRYDLLIKKIKAAMSVERTQSGAITKRTPPDIRTQNRAQNAFNTSLFDYIKNLLANREVLVFGQELLHHDTYKHVDTNWKLGHSGIRYLSQYENEYRPIAKKYCDLSLVPQDKETAFELYLKLAFPNNEASMKTNFSQLNVKSGDSMDTVAAKDLATAKAFDTATVSEFERMAKVVPKDPRFSYWFGQILFGRGKINDAVTEMMSAEYDADRPLQERMTYLIEKNSSFLSKFFKLPQFFTQVLRKGN